METVACVGACALAPVITIDDQVYGLLDEKKAREIIEAILEQEGGK